MYNVYDLDLYFYNKRHNDINDINLPHNKGKLLKEISYKKSHKKVKKSLESQKVT